MSGGAIISFRKIKQFALIDRQRLEEARRKREEKKIQRQKELEARRANRSGGGPMKLGAKKI